MAGEFNRQSVIDEEHLKLLSICYMISAAISACFSMMGLMYAGMGAVVSEAIEARSRAGDEMQPTHLRPRLSAGFSGQSAWHSS